MSFTQLYEALVRQLSDRYVENRFAFREELGVNKQDIDKVKIKSELFQRLWRLLGRIALEGMDSEDLLFTNTVIHRLAQQYIEEMRVHIALLGGEKPSSLDTTDSTQKKDSAFIAFLQSCPRETSDEDVDDALLPIEQAGFLKSVGEGYYFLHLTFQEYFAAWFLVDWWKSVESGCDDQVALYTDRKDSSKSKSQALMVGGELCHTLEDVRKALYLEPRFEMILRFISGLLREPDKPLHVVQKVKPQVQLPSGTLSVVQSAVHSSAQQTLFEELCDHFMLMSYDSGKYSVLVISKKEKKAHKMKKGFNQVKKDYEKQQLQRQGLVLLMYLLEEGGLVRKVNHQFCIGFQSEPGSEATVSSFNKGLVELCQLFKEYALEVMLRDSTCYRRTVNAQCEAEYVKVVRCLQECSLITEYLAIKPALQKEVEQQNKILPSTQAFMTLQRLTAFGIDPALVNLELLTHQSSSELTQLKALEGLADVVLTSAVKVQVVDALQALNQKTCSDAMIQKILFMYKKQQLAKVFSADQRVAFLLHSLSKAEQPDTKIAIVRELLAEDQSFVGIMDQKEFIVPLASLLMNLCEAFESLPKESTTLAINTISQRIRKSSLDDYQWVIAGSRISHCGKISAEWLTTTLLLTVQAPERKRLNVLLGGLCREICHRSFYDEFQKMQQKTIFWESIIPSILSIPSGMCSIEKISRWLENMPVDMIKLAECLLVTGKDLDDHFHYVKNRIINRLRDKTVTSNVLDCPRLLQQAWVYTALQERLDSTVWEVKEEALRGLLLVNPQDEHIIPCVVGVIMEGEASHLDCVLKVLSRSGRESLREQIMKGCIEHLKNNFLLKSRWKCKIRFKSMSRLAQVWEVEAYSLIEVLKDSLSDEKEWVRKEAVEMLGQLGSHLGDLAKIMKMLSDPANEVRCSTVKALKQLSSQSKHALAVIEGLQQAMRDENEDVRQAAIEALGQRPQLGDHAPAVIDGLQLAMEDVDESVRRAAIKALGQLGPQLGDFAPAVIEGLCQSMGDEKWHVRQAAGEMLVRLGSQDKYASTVIEGLRQAMGDVHEDVRRAAIKTLGQLGPQLGDHAPAVIEGLREAMGDVDEFVCRAAIQALGQLEPQFGDYASTVVEGLWQAMGNENKNVRRAAGKMLVRLGSQDNYALAVIERLRQAMGNVDEDVRRAAIEALGQLRPQLGDHAPTVIEALRQAMRDVDENVRRAAIKALGQLGPQLGDHAPAVIEGLRQAMGNENKNVRRTAIKALGQLGLQLGNHAPTVLEALRQAMGNGKRTIRRAAIKALGQLGPQLGSHTTAVIEGLCQTMGDVDEDVCAAAGKVLMRLGSQDEYALAVIAGLRQAMRDEKWTVRGAAIEVLDQLRSQLGDYAPAVIEGFRQAMRDEKEYVRRAAIKALGQLGSQLGDHALAVIEGLRKAVRDKKKHVRQAAIEALDQLGPQLGDHTPAVIEKLRQVIEDKQIVHNLAAEVLGQLGPQLGDQVPAVIERLRQAMGDENKDVRRAAIQALGQLGPQLGDLAAAVIERLRQAMGDEKWSVRRAAIETLDHLRSQLGDQVPAVIERLRQAMGEENKDVRRAAIQALGQLEPQLGDLAAAVIERLRQAMGDENKDVRRAAIQALDRLRSQLGDYAPVVIEGLRQAMGDEKWSVRRAAIKALSQLGPQLGDHAPAVIAGLRQAMEDKEEIVRQAAIKALVQLGPQLGNHVSAVIERLQQMMGDVDEDVRRTAVEMLARLGVQDEYAPAVIEGLCQALGNENKDVRRTAGEVLVRLGSQDKYALAVIAGLRQVMRDVDKDVWRAAEVLVRLGSQDEYAPDVIEGLQQAMGDADKDIRLTAVAALTYLTQFGDHAPAVIGGLCQAIGDVHEDVRHAAIKALDRLIFHLGDHAPAVIEGLRQAMGNEDEDVRRVAIEALDRLRSQLGDHAPAVIEGLRQAMGDADKDVRWAAITALDHLGPQLGDHTPVVIEKLCQAMEDKEGRVRRAAREMLVRLGSQDEYAPAVIEGLRQAMRDVDEDVRRAAIKALGQLEPPLGGHAPAVIEELPKVIRNEKDEESLPDFVFKKNNFIPMTPLMILLSQYVHEHDRTDNVLIEPIRRIELDDWQQEKNTENAKRIHVIIERVNNLHSGQCLLLPINCNNLHFTLLAIYKASQQDVDVSATVAVYVDSFGDFNQTTSIIERFCQLINTKLTCLNESYQANNDCAIHVYENAKLLLSAKMEEFQARWLWNRIQAERLNVPDVATQRRYAFAQRACQHHDVQAVYSLIQIDESAFLPLDSEKDNDSLAELSSCVGRLTRSPIHNNKNSDTSTPTLNNNNEDDINYGNN